MWEIEIIVFVTSVFVTSVFAIPVFVVPEVAEGWYSSEGKG